MIPVVVVVVLAAAWLTVQVAGGGWRRVWVRWRWTSLCRSVGATVRRDRIVSPLAGPGERTSPLQQVEHAPALLGLFGRPVGPSRARTGATWRLWAAQGQTTSELAAVADRFAAATWARRAVIEPVTPRSARLTLLWRDPFEQARGWYPAAHGRTRPAFDIQGRPVDLPMLDAWGGSWLIGAASGAGKSAWMNAIAADWVRQPADTRVLLAIDLKVVEFAPWQQAFDRVACNRTDALALLRSAAAFIPARMAALEAAGLRHVPDVPTAAWPHIVIFIDELGALLNGKGAEFDEARRLLADVAMLGRAAGVLLICAIQRPTVDAIPAAIRDNLGRRVLLRVANLDQARAVLGWMPDQATVDQLNVPGLGLIDVPGREPFLARSTFGTVDDVTAVAAAHAITRPTRRTAAA